MSDSPNDSTNPDIPAFADLAADPEIAALLDFEPVPIRKKVNGWDAEAQRAFIVLLAATGSKLHAAEAIGRKAGGIDRILKRPDAASFSAAVDAAMALAARRNGRAIAQGVADTLAHSARKSSAFRFSGAAAPSPLEGEGDWEDDALNANGLPANDEQMWDLIRNIGTKFMRKVAAEREARLAGEIVAADFYLRQITVIEVTLDLLAAGIGWDAQEVLRELRRGEHGLYEIASTPLADWMDRSRREWWRQEGEPERPPHPDVRFLERHASSDGDYATETDMYACHGMRPPPGISQDEWHAMTKAEQQAAIDAVQAELAQEQREWEAKAFAEHSERTRSDK